MKVIRRPKANEGNVTLTWRGVLKALKMEVRVRVRVRDIGLKL